jgi:hypothetical protein
MIVVCLESPDSSSIFSLELAEFNIVHISMQTYGRYTVQKLIVPASYQNSNNFPVIGQFDYTLIPVISFP